MIARLIYLVHPQPLSRADRNRTVGSLGVLSLNPYTAGCAA